MNLPRAGAKFCSQKCGTYYRRKAKKGAPFPSEMTEKARFVRFTSSKRPITTAGKSASSTNSETWTDYATASASTKGEGVGFVLGAGVGCIDLDHCFQDGELLPWAREIIDRCPDTFMEVSRSGDGLHIFGLLPEGPGRNIRKGGSCVEFYSTGRYIALTGQRFESAPLSLADLSGVIASVS